MNATNVRQAQQFLDRMISVSKDRCDWMTVHRGLLLKSLMNQVILVSRNENESLVSKFIITVTNTQDFK